MIKLIGNLPDNVLGFAAEGKVTGKDYETILIPAVESKFRIHKKVSLLYQLGSSFTGFELTAMLDDAKVGMAHLSHWDKIALVSDHQLINTFAKFFGYMLPCEVRIFKNTELEQAKEWISEK